MADPRPDSEETVELLNRAAAGDPAAVDDLLARHRQALRAFVAGRLDPALRARLDPSDVVQDTLADSVRRLADYLNRRPMPFHLWVRKAAYERTLKARRDHRAACRDVGREAAAPDDSSLALARSLVGPEPTPSEAIQARELADRVATAVSGLPEAEREILTLRQVDNLLYEEVAVLLDIDAATARQRYGRALIKLQNVLAAQGLTRGYRK